MKPHPNNLKFALFALAAVLLAGQAVQAQDPYTGMWEGKFMQDFHTAILLEASDGDSYQGKILMYSGEVRIQDDELSRISIENNTLTFYIAAKETLFKGTFNEEHEELSGMFVFPDESEHALVVRKKEKENSHHTSPESTPVKQIREKIPVEDLKSDLKHLINKLREYHPRLYSHTSEDAFNAKASRIFSSLNHAMSLEEYYLQIAPLVASIKCSHTGIRLPSDYQEDLYTQASYLPLDIHIQKHRLYALSGCGNKKPGLVPGTEILSINQRSGRQIIEQLLKLIPAEGNNQTAKYQELNQHFHPYYHLLDPSRDFELVYGSAEDPKQVLMEARTFHEIKTENTYEDRSPVLFHIQRDPDMAILKVQSFGIRDMESYFALLDSAFLVLKTENIPQLVLDLRDNKGGHPIFAAQLFSYLTDGDFTYFQPNKDAVDFEPLYHPMQANKLHFKGDVYVMVNGHCLSTTGHLISLIKYHTNARFMGEEPGSSYLCNDKSTQLRLPHSGLEVNIPRTTFVTAVKGFSDSIPFPVDYPVDISVQDLIQQKDSYFEYVETLISAK
jgi:hypothetical protein